MYYGTKLLDLYTDGLEIAKIAVSLHKTKDEVIEELRNFKKDNIISNGGRNVKTVYTDLFIEAIVDRNLRGIGKPTIAEELKMGQMSISNIIQNSKFAIDYDSLKEDNDDY